MSWDYLNSESEEVKRAFSQIRDTERALQKAMDNYRPSVTGEYYLNGDEVCDYLHISPRTLQTLRDRRQIHFSVISGRVFLYPESGIRDLLGRNLKPAEKR